MSRASTRISSCSRDNLRRRVRVEIGSPLLLDFDLLANEQHEQPAAEGLFDGARAGRHHFLECGHHEADGALGAGGAAGAEDARGFVAGSEVIGELFVESLLAQRRLETLRVDLAADEQCLAVRRPPPRAWCGESSRG